MTKKSAEILTALPITKEDLLELELDVDPTEMLLALFHTATLVITGKNDPLLTPEALRAMGLESGAQIVFSLNGVMNTFALNNLVTDINKSVQNQEAQEYISATKIADYIREMTQIKDVILETEEILRKAKSEEKIQQYRIVLHSLQRILNILYELLSKYIKDPKKIQQYLAKAEEENQRHLQEKNQNHGLFEKILSVIKDAMNSPKNDKLEQLISELNRNDIKDYLSNLLNDEILKNMMLINQFEIIKMLKMQMHGIFRQENLDRIRKMYDEGSKTKEDDIDFLVRHILIPVGNFVRTNFTHVADNASLNHAIKNKKAVCVGKVNILISLFEYLNIPYKNTSPSKSITQEEILHNTIDIILPNGKRLFMDTNHYLPWQQQYLNPPIISNLQSKEAQNYFSKLAANVEKMKDAKLDDAFFLCYYLQETKSSEFCYPVHYIGKKGQTLYTHVPYPENDLSVEPMSGILNFYTYSHLMHSINQHLSREEMVAILDKFEKDAPHDLSYFLISAEYKVRIYADFTQALNIIENGLKMFPNSYRLLFNKAKYLSKLGRKDEALQIARELAFGQNSPPYLEFKYVLRDFLLSDFMSNSDYHKITLDIFEIDPEYLRKDEFESAIKYFTDEITKLLNKKHIKSALKLFLEIKQKIGENLNYELLNIFVAILDKLFIEAKETNSVDNYQQVLNQIDIEQNFIQLIPSLKVYKESFFSEEKLDAVITILKILKKPDFPKLEEHNILSNADSEPYLQSIINLSLYRFSLFDTALMSLSLYAYKHDVLLIEPQIYSFSFVTAIEYKNVNVIKNLPSLYDIFNQISNKVIVNLEQSYNAPYNKLIPKTDFSLKQEMREQAMNLSVVYLYILLSAYPDQINQYDVKNQFYKLINTQAQLYKDKNVYLNSIKSLITSHAIVQDKGEKFKQELLADFAKYTV